MNPTSPAPSGLLLGAIGVAIFSLTLPCTRLAVAYFDPVWVALARGLVAALCAGLYLLWRRARLPSRGDLVTAATVAGGVVFGFPLCSSLALEHLAAGHAAVMGGLLPLMTACAARLRTPERPQPAFWLCAVAGTLVVCGYALGQSKGNLSPGDLLMVAAVALGAWGYAEGAVLARRLGGPEAISWALVMALPVTLPATLCLPALRGSVHAASAAAWAGLLYVSLFSMFLGFFFWYEGLARGGVARVSQVQLLQPFLSIGAAALLLREHIDGATLACAAVVMVLVALGRRFASATAPLTVPAPILRP